MKFTTTQILLALAIVCFLFMLAGCATEQMPTTVKVAIPVKCKAIEAERPVMPTEQLSAATVTTDAFVQAAAAEIELREGYEERLRTALRSCK